MRQIMPRVRARELSSVAWRISTRSGGENANCVEAGPVLSSVDWHISSHSKRPAQPAVEPASLRGMLGQVAVRHSRHPDSEVVLCAIPEWRTFMDALKTGHFDF